MKTYEKLMGNDICGMQQKTARTTKGVDSKRTGLAGRTHPHTYTHKSTDNIVKWANNCQNG